MNMPSAHERFVDIEATLTPPEMRTPPTLGVATLDDLDTVATHMEMVYADTYPNDRGITRDMFDDNPAFQAEMRKYLGQQLTDPTKTLFIARQAGRILGTVGIGPNPKLPSEGKVWGFYVDPALQGQGVSQQLWALLEDYTKVAGFDSLALDVAKDSERAVAFYKRRGFMITGEEDWDWPHWTDERPHNQYWLMAKQLRP